MKKIAILQSNYIPWKGYFDLISYVDEFIIYDDVQYTKNDWRNRNKIKTANGLQWITIPVRQGLDQRIKDVTVSDRRWRKKHWKTFETNYRKAPFFTWALDRLWPLYYQTETDNLSEINIQLLQGICSDLQVKTIMSNSEDYDLIGDRNARLINLCIQAKAESYVSGASAQSYLDVQSFNDEGIKVEWFDYSGYRSYPQLWGDFAHEVSILDLLFNCGPESHKYMKYI